MSLALPKSWSFFGVTAVSWELFGRASLISDTLESFQNLFLPLADSEANMHIALICSSDETHYTCRCLVVKSVIYFTVA